MRIGKGKPAHIMRYIEMKELLILNSSFSFAIFGFKRKMFLAKITDGNNNDRRKALAQKRPP